MFKALAPLLALVIATGLGLTYVKPTYESIEKIKMETVEYQNAIDKAGELERLLKERMDRKRSLDVQYGNRLSDMLPLEVKEVAIIKDLDALARTHKISIVSISVQKEDREEKRGKRSSGAEEEIAAQAREGDDAHYTSRDINLGLLGTYEDFRTFLTDIERSLVFFDVTSLKFTESEGDLMQFDITLRTYAFTGSLMQEF